MLQVAVTVFLILSLIVSRVAALSVVPHLADPGTEDYQAEAPITWHDDILTEDTDLTDGWNGIPKGCGGKPAEVYFVLDTSSIPDPDMNHLARQTRYLSNLLSLFYLHKSVTRVGVLSYGQSVTLVSPLNAPQTVQGLTAALQRAPQVGGQRNTAQVLKYLRVHGFSTRVARREVAHVVILLTTGPPSSIKQAHAEAEQLKRQGVYLYVVRTLGAGSSSARDQHQLASAPSHQFHFALSDLAIVQSLVHVLHINDCNYQVMPPLKETEAMCSSRRPAQLAFALDHLSLGGSRAQLVLFFIQQLLSHIDPSSDIKAAILTSRDPMSGRDLSGQVETIDSVERKLGEIVFPELGQLLKQARRTLTSGAYAAERTLGPDSTSAAPHRDVQKVLTVFVDQSMELTKGALAAAAANRRHKIDTYVIHVTEEPQPSKETEELARRLASGKDHVIRVKSYEDLLNPTVLEAVLGILCRGL